MGRPPPLKCREALAPCRQQTGPQQCACRQQPLTSLDLSALQVRHDRTVTWLAFWRDPVLAKGYKYVWLGANSLFKTDSDLAKYEKARKLKVRPQAAPCQMFFRLQGQGRTTCGLRHTTLPCTKQSAGGCTATTHNLS